MVAGVAPFAEVDLDRQPPHAGQVDRQRLRSVRPGNRGFQQRRGLLSPLTTSRTWPPGASGR